MSVGTPDAGDRPARCWIAVACDEHVQRGAAGGFMQVCHGKVAPLHRIQPGDRVVYYAPSTAFRGKDRLQAFTALGTVQAGPPYPFDMGAGFVPWRRDVRWEPVRSAPIHPLLATLDFSRGASAWAAPLRFGLLAIGEDDMARIAAAMGAAPGFIGPRLATTAPPADAGAPPGGPAGSVPHTPSLWPELPAR